MLQDAVTHLRELAHPETILKHYGVKHISNNGYSLRCACPIHKGDNQTAFVFNLENKLWYCHTKDCGGGDIYDLIMKIEDLSFTDAVCKLAEILHIDISTMDIQMRTNKVLLNTKTWIEKMRCLTMSASHQSEFDVSILGDLFPIKSYRNFNTRTLNHFNVKFCQANKRVVIPIYSNKKLIGVTMRRTQEHPAKWLHQPTGLQMRNILFNYDNIVRYKPLIVVEGVFDVFAYWQAGYKNVVATFGCHMTQAQERQILLATHEIVLSYDNDDSGKLGTNIAIGMLKDKINIKIANLPMQNDPGQLDENNIKKAIKNSYRVYEWRNVNG